MLGMKSLIAVCLSIAFALAGTSLQTPTPVTKSRSTPVAVGEMAPDFTLEDHHGNKITFSEARGKTPVVLVFYRGYW